MKVTLIGSGNLATVLGRRIHSSGHLIHEIYNRTASNAESLAKELEASYQPDLLKIDSGADIYLVCLSDSVLKNVGTWLKLPGKMVAHTAGSVSIDVLKGVSQHYGVVYPLQTLRKELPGSPALPIFVDGNDEWTKTKLGAFAQSFADNVNYADDDKRSKLHLAAVITNNFSNHLFTLAEDFCRKEGMDFKMLVPLLEETVRRLNYASPVDVQTGPAIRHDHQTIEKHLVMLEEYPELKEMYRWFSEQIRTAEGKGQRAKK